MSQQPTSAPDSADLFIAEFLRELDGAADPVVVVRKYCERRPDRAEEVRDVAAMRGALGGVAPPAPPPPPQRLGEFRILRRIAGGGMGEIYEAEQGSLPPRKVAVKVIRRDRASPEARTRFEREAKVLARLHQTNIVPIYTAGEEDGLQYFAMPYIEGTTLSDAVARASEEGRQPGSRVPPLKDLASRALQEGRNGKASRAATAQSAQRFPTTSPNVPGEPESAPVKAVVLRAGALLLSAEYFRSVAALMADAAEAMHHVHQAGIIHRDLKPGNIMVEVCGPCKVIDFGLATYLNGRHDRGEGEEGLLGPEPVTASGLLGTLHYMAPEQVKNYASVCSDVWGLGVTLYELLTLCRPFDGPSAVAILRQIENEDPKPPRTLVRNVPPDLAAICQKAMRKAPDQRYPSAQEFAADLRRWLRHEPTVARPARTPRRLWLWARRNPGWAASLAFVLLAIGSWVSAIMLAAKVRAARAEARTEAAEEEARRSDEQRRASEREIALQKIQQLRLANRGAGWFAEVWRRVKDVARSGNKLELRNQAAAALAGLEVEPWRRFPHPTSSVAFHPDGKRLLMGGTETEEARLWDGSGNEPAPSGLVGAGPVAFAADGTPLQLVARKDGTVLLWDVAKRRRVQEFKLPGLAKLEVPGLALSPNGSLVAASARLRDNKATIKVWEARSGKLLREFERYAMALAFSPDGKFFAAGDEDGGITIWPVPDGEPIAKLRADRAAILALAFGRNVRRGSGEEDPRLLAAGDSGGTVTVWDVRAGRLLSSCRGSYHHVHAVAFSPDGMTLASTGREDVKLWDVATGRLLLNVGECNWMTGLAFSPDGKRLAASSEPAFSSPGRVSVWKLEKDRGIQTLRGLTAQVEKVLFSPNEQFLAALSHDSRVAVWDLKNGRLLHVFEAPKALWADNAALAFSPDSRQLAFSGSSERAGQARLWEVASGKEVGSWTFSPGLENILAFHPGEKLLLFQMEERAGERLPDSSMPPPDHPRVWRVRDLLADAKKPLTTISEFNGGVKGHSPVVPEDGRFFALVGFSGRQRPEKQQIKVFDTLSGKELWASDAVTADTKVEWRELSLDRTGRFLTVLMDNRGGLQASLVEMPSGKLLGSSPFISSKARGWSPVMPYWLPYYNFALVPRGKKEPVVVLGIDTQPTGTQYQFNADGSHFAWGNANGTVNVCDIEAVRRRLTAVGLGW